MNKLTHFFQMHLQNLTSMYMAQYLNTKIKYQRSYTKTKNYIVLVFWTIGHKINKHNKKSNITIWAQYNRSTTKIFKQK